MGPFTKSAAENLEELFVNVYLLKFASTMFTIILKLNDVTVFRLSGIFPYEDHVRCSYYGMSFEAGFLRFLPAYGGEHVALPPPY